MQIEILFQDNYCLAVHKPNNILVHHSKMANNKFEEASLVQLLQRQTKQKYYPIHRLDRKTSGVLILVKQKEYVAVFQKMFLSNQIQKTYFGVVRGFSPSKLTINSPVKGRDALVYKNALTHLQTIANHTCDIAVHPYPNSRYSLVKLHPKTGRLHQLRIHLNKISHPLIGDPKYGDRFHNRMFEKQYNCNSLFLHAHSLTFTHPVTQQQINITASFPLHWHTIAKQFNWNKFSFLTKKG